MKQVLIIVAILAVVGLGLYSASVVINKEEGIKQKMESFVSSTGNLVWNINTASALIKEYDPNTFKEILETNKRLEKSQEELRVFIEEQNNIIKELEIIVQESNSKAAEILANIPQLTDTIPETLEQALELLEDAKHIIKEQDKVIKEQQIELTALRGINQNQGLIISRQENHIKEQSEFIDSFVTELNKVRRQANIRASIGGALIIGAIYLVAGGA